MIKLPNYLFLFLLTFSYYASAQDLNRSLIFGEGDKLFENQQYVKAMRFYKEVLDQEPGHLGAMYQMGECYRLTFDYESALYYYEKITRANSPQFPLAGFQYANMLKHAGEFNRALQEFDTFGNYIKELGLQEDERYRIYYKQGKIEKEGCLLALNDLTNPKPAHDFKICSDDINTEYMDFAAFTYGDDEFLCLTSSRSGGKGNLVDYRFGESFADIFRFRNDGDKWQPYTGSDKLEKIINTKWGDGSGAFNLKGDKFYYTNCNNELGDVCHIFVSTLVKGSWTEPVALGESINLPNFDSRHPNISPSGDTLFFASNRPGGHGNYDIYMSINAGGENWSQAQNLGDQINTPFFEVSPFYDSQQGVLFFSSDGHRGYGGFDVYMAKGYSFFDPEIFNPGFPFNTNNDEVFMNIGKTKGYLSSNRDGGFGRLDIYEFSIKTQEEIITEISGEEAVAGRNSLFSDDYDFDSNDREAIDDIISSFLAAKEVDVELALTDELNQVYQRLSLDDRERINRIIFARIRKLSEKDLQALRIEDEFFYKNLNSTDKSHLDNIITRYIEEDDLAITVNLNPEDAEFYQDLTKDARERTDHLIATRIKQSHQYEFEPKTYAALEKVDKQQVDKVAYLYLEEKANIDQLRLQPTQNFYLKGLTPEKKETIYLSIKEKLLTISKDSRFDLTEDDRLFYQNLSSEHLDALHAIASAFLISGVGNLEISQDYLKIYRLYSATQRKSLDRILAKIIANTIKSDVYHAEAKLSDREKQLVSSIGKDEIDAYIEGVTQFGNEGDTERIKRFLAVSGPTWSPDQSVFVQPVDVSALAANSASKVLMTNPSERTGNKASSIAGDQNQNSDNQSSVTGSGSGSTSSNGQSEQVSELTRNGSDGSDNGNTIRPKIEKEQNIETLSSSDLQFYENLPSDQQKATDRIIAMKFLNESYRDKSLKAADDGYYKQLSSAEKTYIKLLSKHMGPDPLEPAEKSLLNEAFVFYSNLAIPLKAKWNRIVASEALVKDGESYKIFPQDATFRRNLTPDQLQRLSNVETFRLANQRLVSENFTVESRDMPSNAVNFGVAKFSNNDYPFVSVSGKLIDNVSGAPLVNVGLLAVNGIGEVVAKTSTGRSGHFDFEDLPRGSYKVVSEKPVAKSAFESPFFVKDLEVRGSSEGNFAHTVRTNIYFEFDSYELRSEARVTLQEIANLARKQDIYLELKSHTDDIGADDYNLNLSEQRNAMAMSALKRMGIQGDKLEWLAMGHSSPVAPNDTEFGRQFNRRIEILIKSNRLITYIPADIYLVRPKGTLYSISQHFGLDVSEIQAANGMKDTSIEAYRPLRIPNPKGIKPNLNMLVALNESVADPGNYYTVKRGENVEVIAEKFNLPEELIMEMNGLNSLEVNEGRRLKIYVRSR